MRTLKIVELNLEPNQIYKSRTINTYGFIALNNHNYRITSNNQSYEVSVNEYFTLDLYDEFTIKTDKALHFYLILFDKTLMEQKGKTYLTSDSFKYKNNERLIRSSSENRAFLYILIKRYFISLEVTEVYQDMELSSITALIIIQYNRAKQFSENFKVNKSSFAAIDILSYLDENYMNNINVTMIANHFGLTKEYLATIFKKEFGTTISKALESKRLKTSVELLRNGEAPTVVYKQVGFNSYNTFYKAFKRKYGKEPLQIKR